MVEHAADKLDINQVNNSDGSTIFGTLFYQSEKPFYENNGFQPKSKLKLIHQYFGSKIKKNAP